jgi:hypothetical protein
MRELLNHVEDSANLILLLTRRVFERPWVLAEIVRAFKTGNKLILVNCVWPGGDMTSPHGRSFRFPQHLDDTIDQWQEFYYESNLRGRADDGQPRHFARALTRLGACIGQSGLFKGCAPRISKHEGLLPDLALMSPSTPS